MTTTTDKATAATNTIRGKIVWLFHSSPTFCAGKISVDGTTHSFAGKVFVKQGELVALRGSWQQHEKYGMQFAVSERLYEDELSVEGLAHWLATTDAAVGIGPVKALKIAEAYGADFEAGLTHAPEAMAQFAGVPIKNILALADDWNARKSFNAIATKLSAWKLTQHQIETLFAKFGGSTIQILEDNPYTIIGEIEGFAFRKVDDIALKLGIEKTSPKRIKAAALFAVHDFLDKGGSTLVPSDELNPKIGELLSMDTTEQVDVANTVTEELIDDGKLIRIYDAGGDEHIGLPWVLKMERFVGAFLDTGRKPNPHFKSQAGIASLVAVESESDNLDDSQRAAVEMSLSNRITLITGGAGSGKTHTIKTLRRLFKRQRLDVVMCAPTGKAARRMEQTIPNSTASTIHRLLKYFPGKGFQVNADNPLPADVVIVDEVSMVDVPLAYALFSAITPRTSVILVGDHNQLPPVGPGNVLRDIVNRDLTPVARLDTCHRQAGPLKANSVGILSGKVAATVITPAHPYPWYVVDGMNDAAQIVAYIQKLFTDHLPRHGFDPLVQTQFLTPNHKGELGTKSLNIHLQRLRQAALGVTVAPPEGPDDKLNLYPMDKVIQTKNDYDLDIMNGHQGIVIRTTPQLQIKFDNRTVTINYEKSKSIQLAYCLTTHKCQGSEWPCVVVVCHRSHFHPGTACNLHRNWLYTSVTRASRTAIILGDKNTVRRTAEKVDVDKRKTWLSISEDDGNDYTWE